MAVYNIDENLTPVLLSAMRTCLCLICWSLYWSWSQESWSRSWSWHCWSWPCSWRSWSWSQSWSCYSWSRLQHWLVSTFSTDLFISSFGNDCCLVIHVRFIVHFCRVVWLTVIYVYFLLQSCVHYSVVCQRLSDLSEWLAIIFCNGTVFSASKHFCASAATYWPRLNKQDVSKFIEMFYL